MIFLRITADDLVLVVLHDAKVLLGVGIKFLGLHPLIFSEEDMICLLSEKIDHPHPITL